MVTTQISSAFSWSFRMDSQFLHVILLTHTDKCEHTYAASLVRYITIVQQIVAALLTRTVHFIPRALSGYSPVKILRKRAKLPDSNYPPLIKSKCPIVPSQQLKIKKLPLCISCPQIPQASHVTNSMNSSSTDPGTQWSPGSPNHPLLSSCKPDALIRRHGWPSDILSQKYLSSTISSKPSDVLPVLSSVNFFTIVRCVSSMFYFSSFLLLGPIAGALAAIGPVTDLHIVNSFIQPDGFNRSGVLAEGVFPGPLITGNKVCSVCSHFIVCRALISV